MDKAREERQQLLSRSTSSQETVTSEGQVDQAIASDTTSLPTGTHLADFKLFDESEVSVVPNIIGYELSKTKAELEAWNLVSSHNDKESSFVQLVVLCPGFIFGPSESDTAFISFPPHSRDYV